MNLNLKRRWFTENSTVGELFVDGKWECYILEDAARPVGVKVPGKTCIPEGLYNVSLTLSPRFRKTLPLIYNHPDYSCRDGRGVKFEGVRIHAGNTDKDAEGCLIPGQERTKDMVMKSRDALKALMEKLVKAIKDKEIPILKIENCPVS